MRLATLLGVLGLASAALAEGPRCRVACERWVTDVRLRALACGRCPLDRGEADWLSRLPAAPDGALADDDWQVRWRVLELQAAAKGAAPEKRLAAWITAASSEAERKLACATALRAAGSKGQPLAALLAGSTAAANACAPLLPAVRTAEELGLYDEALPARLACLRQLAAGLGVGTGRVALDALKSRGAVADELTATLLVDAARDGGPPAGLALLRDATAADTAPMNRLLAVYSRSRDALAAELRAPEKDRRRRAALELGLLAPLSQGELTTALEDEAAAVRVAAARGLARGEGRTVTEAVRARFSGGAPARLKERHAWLLVLQDDDQQDCGAFTLELARDASQPDSLRADALVAHASCAHAASLPALEAAFAEASPAMRAAAVRGAALVPRESRADALAEQGLASADAPVQLAALEAAPALHLRKAGPLVSPLCQSGAAEVRAAAYRALAQLEGDRARSAAAKCLRTDAAPAVRATCAELLGQLGGSAALGALVEARKSDADAHVKFVATESLRRLGVSTP